jgi:large subunit ribosomal protein L20
MTRVKRGLATHKRHKKLIARAKGYRMMNGNIFSRVKNALAKAGTNAYIHRRTKKRDFRALWIVRLNSAIRPLGMTYSAFINLLYKKHVEIDRKNLSNLAISHPQIFSKVVEFVK